MEDVTIIRDVSQFQQFQAPVVEFSRASCRQKRSDVQILRLHFFLAEMLYLATGNDQERDGSGKAEHEGNDERHARRHGKAAFRRFDQQGAEQTKEQQTDGNPARNASQPEIKFNGRVRQKSILEKFVYCAGGNQNIPTHKGADDEEDGENDASNRQRNQNQEQEEFDAEEEDLSQRAEKGTRRVLHARRIDELLRLVGGTHDFLVESGGIHGLTVELKPLLGRHGFRNDCPKGEIDDRNRHETENGENHQKNAPRQRVVGTEIVAKTRHDAGNHFVIGVAIELTREETLLVLSDGSIVGSSIGIG